MKMITIAIMALLAVSLPAMAQAVAPAVDPAQQAFVASILKLIGGAMIANADNWAGWLLLSVPPLAGLVGWLLPREWLLGILGWGGKLIGFKKGGQ